MDIAVIGGGIAGLAAAWLLGREHRVTLFERQAQPGFVASSVAVPAAGGEVRVDVPLRVFYPGYYPTLCRLYAELGVATEPVNYATTFVDTEGRDYFRWRNLRLGGLSLPFVWPHDLAGARARRIVAGAMHFNGAVRAALAAGELAGCSVGEFVAAHKISPVFVHGLLLPALATIATCTTEDALAYPAEVVAGYMAQGLSRQSVRRAVLGADDVAARLLAGVPRVVCEAGVVGVRQVSARGAGGVQVLRQGLPEERFDHVVMATQANHALTLWQGASGAEAAVMKAFRYRALEVLMHRDESFMPARRTAWSPVNARVGASHESPESTIWINRVQPALRHAPLLLQTVQPQREPRADLVIGRARFERPLVDTASAPALAALQQLHAQPGRRVWLCGSYAQAGVPLLESAVRSAYAVAERIAAVYAKERAAWADAEPEAERGRVALKRA